jgi:hypothetical protein
MAGLLRPADGLIQPAGLGGGGIAYLPQHAEIKTHSPRRATLLAQPGLEHRFFAGLGKLVKVFLHASLDTAAPGRNLTAEIPDIGFASAQHRPRGGALGHRAGCRE